MLIPFAAMCGGLVLLMYGADRFVDGAAATASNLGIPPLLVGLVIVGFATSAPEMLVSAVAAFNGSPSLGIGNAIGSNIANIGLVLGGTALLAPLTVRSAVLKREFPLMVVVMVGSSVLMLDNRLDRVDGILLLIGLVLMIAISVWSGRNSSPDDPIVEELNAAPDKPMSPLRAWLMLAFGLGLLLLGSELLVDGAVDVAKIFGVSDVVIGLTIVAIGTSLPELAASLMSGLKGKPEIALGNVIGSNMFNALAVLSMPALIAPSTFDVAVVQRDIPYMLIMTAALFFFSWSYRRVGEISRLDGAFLLAGFVAYQTLLFTTQ